MDTALTLNSLTKSFGSNRGIENVTLSVKPGEIVGFLGPNGAGKTTTINLIMGFTSPTSGYAEVFGHNSTTQGIKARQSIGFLSNDMSLDEGLTGAQEIEYLGKLYGSMDTQYITELANRLNVELDKKTRNLSRGNKQKIGLLSALMHKPEILILDEPTSGLDPLIQATFNSIILEHKKAGRTAFISSHVLSEVEELCDRFIFIREGKIIADKTPDQLKKHAARHVSITSSSVAKLHSILNELKGVEDVNIHESTVSFLFSGDINQLLREISKLKILSLEIHEADLEQVFMNYYEGQGTK